MIGIIYRDFETGTLQYEQGLKERFNAMLDDSYEWYKLGDGEYSPSEIMKNCDPVAYRCSFADYLSDWEELEETPELREQWREQEGIAHFFSPA